MATETLTPEQTDALLLFGEACQAFQRAAQALDNAGLDMPAALRLIQDEEGNSLYDQLPPAIRMML